MIRTHRLILRPWTDEDRAPFAALCADPRVMEFFPKTLDRAECDAMVDRIARHFQEHGFGLWAVEAPGVAPFIGFVGLWVPDFTAHFTPCVEIGWRLDAPYWGHGYASEGARAALDVAFGEHGLAEVVSMTALTNVRSQRVMQRLGMTCAREDDFDHPKLAAGHPLARHVLYRITRAQWSARPSA